MTLEEEGKLMSDTIRPAADEMDAKLIAGVPFDVAVVSYRAVAGPAVDRYMAAMFREVESWRPKL
jgi:hypothetical protein